MRGLNKMEIEILHRHAQWLKNKYTGERADLRGANLQNANLEEADLQSIDLRWANLQGANLQGVDLRGSDLSGAYLQGTDLRNSRLYSLRGKVLSFGPIGSRDGITYATKTGMDIDIRCGCFHGTLDDFIAKVEEEYKISPHGIAYRAAIEFIRAYDAAYWQNEEEEEENSEWEY